MPGVRTWKSGACIAASAAFWGGHLFGLKFHNCNIFEVWDIYCRVSGKKKLCTFFGPNVIIAIFSDQGPSGEMGPLAPLCNIPFRGTFCPPPKGQNFLCADAPSSSSKQLSTRCLENVLHWPQGRSSMRHVSRGARWQREAETN